MGSVFSVGHGKNVYLMPQDVQEQTRFNQETLVFASLTMKGMVVHAKENMPSLPLEIQSSYLVEF